MTGTSERTFDAFLAALRRLDYTGYAEQYPPFGSWTDLTRKGSLLPAAWRRSLRLTKEAGLFVNVPFCRQRCRFCFLPVTAIGSSPARRSELFGRYFAALDGEAGFYSPLFKGVEFSTLYIGGGTPSLMTPDETAGFFALLRRRFRFARGLQTVLELHPEDVTREKAESWRSCGVDRVCIGVQSLDERVLSANSRRQGLSRVASAHRTLTAAGIKVNIDLICGLPGQDRRSFLRDLGRVMKLRPDQVHLNTFINTPYTLHARLGGGSGDEKEVEAIRAEGFRRLAGAGYIKVDSDSMGLTPASRNRQSTRLAERRSVLGLGPGAVSRAFGGARYINRAAWADWEGPARRGRPPVERGTLCTHRDEMIYSALTALTDDLAVDLAEFRRRHGADFRKVFAAQARELEAAGGRFAGGKFKLPANMWGLVRKVFYRPEVVARGLANIKAAGH
jgi:oxygen-independent coproporphyrinogen-3 oxidase